ncbi:MAG TPA: cytochrome c3 family protein [Symbiobacteriaceae bacterium]
MRKWGQRILITVGVLFGLFLVLAVSLQSHGAAKVIANPTTCGVCHYMESEVASYMKSDHKEVGCLACHSSGGFFQRPVDELQVATRHVMVTLNKTEPEVLHLPAADQTAMQVNCYGCHKEVVQNLHQDKLGNCTSCHRLSPHQRPARGQ